MFRSEPGHLVAVLGITTATAILKLWGDTGAAQFPGTGLGLAIAQGIVEAHGGRIWIEDADNKQGIRVSLSIPISAEEILTDNFHKAGVRTWPPK